MAEKTVSTRIIQKHDTALHWSRAINFVPKKGELIIYDADTDYTTLMDGYYIVDGVRLDMVTIAGIPVSVTPSSSVRIKIGDGETNVNHLPFIAEHNLAVDSLLANCYNSTNVLDFYNPDYLDTYLETPTNGIKAILLDDNNNAPTNMTNSFLIAPCLDSYIKDTISFVADEDGHHKFGLSCWTTAVQARIASVKMFDASGNIVPFPSQPSDGNNKKVIKFSSFNSAQLYPHAGSTAAGASSPGYGDASPDGTKDAWISNAYGMTGGPYFLGKGTGNGVTNATRDTSMSQDGDGACMKVVTMDTGDIISAGGIYNTQTNTDYTFTFYYNRPTASNHNAIFRVVGGTPQGTVLNTVTVAKAATSGWQKATITFNSGTYERIFVLIIGQGATWAKTSALYIDNICLESDLPPIPSMNDLIQDYVGKESITEITFTAADYALSYPADDRFLHTFGDQYLRTFDTETVAYQNYLFNVATGYLSAGEPYTIEVIWKMLSQYAAATAELREEYTTYSAADKVALVTTSCVTNEPFQTGGFWVGDPIGNRRTAYLRITKDQTRPFRPRVAAVNITGGADTGAEVSLRLWAQRGQSSPYQVCSHSKTVTKNGTALIPFYIADAEVETTEMDSWYWIDIGIANLDPQGHPVTVDKIAIYGDRLGGYSASSFAAIEGNKRVTFDNVVRASEFDGIIDDGCLDVY